MKDKILIFITRYLCYASNEYFAEQLVNALKEYGVQVEVCNIINNDYAETDLTKYIGRKYLAIIDFNSTLPRAMVGDKRFLDLIDGPFYNYIVDHPLYHHPILKIELDNFNVICIDKAHKKYIEEKYPNIKRVMFLPLAGSRAASNVPFDRRQEGILFTGTYYDIEKYNNMINEKTNKDKKAILDLIELLESDIALTPERAFDQLQSDFSDGVNLSNSEYAQQLNSYYLADIYVRALNRKKVIDAFVNTGRNVIILGNEWDKYPKANKTNVRIIPGVDYRESLEIIASCKCLLNILPGFRNGSHDRILTGMINKLTVITDSNHYIDENLDKNFIAYKINDYDKHIGTDECLKDEACRISSIIDDICKIEELALKGYEAVVNKWTWMELADKLIFFLTHK